MLDKKMHVVQTKDGGRAVRLLYREYLGSGRMHATYVCMMHSADDRPLFNLTELVELFDKAGARDGDEVEIVVRRTGMRPFGGRCWVLTAPHTYTPVDEPDASGNTSTGKIDGQDCQPPEPVTQTPLPDRMEEEAGEFAKCRDIHEDRDNFSASAVAERARLRLCQYASELREPESR